MRVAQLFSQISPIFQTVGTVRAICIFARCHRFRHKLITAFTLLTISQTSLAVNISDARGMQNFTRVPQRVVVLNWDLLEQVLELGVTPIGATHLEAYATWVVQPAVPQSVADVGSRAEPNLEKIAALKPDVILAASPQKDLLERLEKIAPVVYLPNFAAQEQAGKTAIAHFKTLAQLFDQQALAEQKLTAMRRQFSQLKAQLEVAFSKPLPPVLVMRFSNLTSVFLYSENSTTQYVLNQLGLQTALPQPSKAWGIVQKRLDELQHIDSGYVLHVRPFPDEDKLQQSVLWRAMPFVQQGHSNAVRPVWSYGGAMSLGYSAEAIAESLLAIAPPTQQVPQ